MFAAIPVPAEKRARICLIHPGSDTSLLLLAALRKWNCLVLLFQEPRRWWLM